MFGKLAQQSAQLSITESYLFDHFPENNLIKFSKLSEAEYGKQPAISIHHPTTPITDILQQRISGHKYWIVQDHLNIGILPIKGKKHYATSSLLVDPLDMRTTGLFFGGCGKRSPHAILRASLYGTLPCDLGTTIRCISPIMQLSKKKNIKVAVHTYPLLYTHP